MANFCREQVVVCGYCAIQGQLIKDSPSKADAGKTACVICKKQVSYIAMRMELVAWHTRQLSSG